MTGPRRLRVGTRGSPLALKQTALVVEALARAFPAVPVEVRTLRTEGDDRPAAPLREIGGRGVFAKAIEEALLAGEVDLAVHSLKDLTTEIPPGLEIVAIPQRGDPRDAFVSAAAPSLATLPAGARVGTSSARRAAQIRALRPDLTVVELRGNIETRLRKATAPPDEGGELDGAVLALAGLQRLGLAERAVAVIDPEEFLPAVGQGALAVQARAGDAELVGLLRALDHLPTRQAVTAERSVLRNLGGGCAAAIGALGTVRGRSLSLQGLVASLDGATVLRFHVEGEPSNAEALGLHLARELMRQGAGALLAQGDGGV